VLLVLVLNAEDEVIIDRAGSAAFFVLTRVDDSCVVC